MMFSTKHLSSNYAFALIGLLAFASLRALGGQYKLTAVDNFACRYSSSILSRQIIEVKIDCFTLVHPELGAKASVQSVSQTIKVQQDSHVYISNSDFNVFRISSPSAAPGVCVRSSIYRRHSESTEAFMRMDCFKLALGSGEKPPLFSLQQNYQPQYYRDSELDKKQDAELKKFFASHFGEKSQVLKEGEANPNQLVAYSEQENIYDSQTPQRNELKGNGRKSVAFMHEYLATIDAYDQIYWRSVSEGEAKSSDSNSQPGIKLNEFSRKISADELHLQLWMQDGVILDLPLSNDWVSLNNFAHKNYGQNVDAIVDESPNPYNSYRREFLEQRAKERQSVTREPVRFTNIFFDSYAEQYAPLYRKSALVWKLFMLTKLSPYIPYQDDSYFFSDLKRQIILELSCFRIAGLSLNSLNPQYLNLAVEVGALPNSHTEIDLNSVAIEVPRLLNFMLEYRRLSPLQSTAISEGELHPFNQQLLELWQVYDSAPDIESEKATSLLIKKLFQSYQTQLKIWGQDPEFGIFYRSLSTWMQNPSPGGSS